MHKTDQSRDMEKGRSLSWGLCEAWHPSVFLEQHKAECDGRWGGRMCSLFSFQAYCTKRVRSRSKGLGVPTNSLSVTFCYSCTFLQKFMQTINSAETNDKEFKRLSRQLLLWSMPSNTINFPRSTA